MTNPQLSPDDEERELLERLAILRQKKADAQLALDKFLADWDLAIAFDLTLQPLSFGIFRTQGWSFYIRPSNVIPPELKAQIAPLAVWSFDYFVIDSRKWPLFREFVAKEAITFKDEITKNAFLFILNGPHYEIRLGTNSKFIEVILSRVADSNLLRGCEVRYLENNHATQETKYRVEIPQGHLLFKAIKDNQKNYNIPDVWIKWDEDCLALIQRDMEKRTLVDTIAQLESCPEFDPKFPTGLKLRPFQEVGGRFLQITERGILGDQPGLGKSPQSIAPAFIEDDYNLVVCPASLRLNWATQIFKFTGQHALIIKGETPNAYMANLIVKEKPHRWVICSYDAIASHVKTVQKVMQNGVEVEKEIKIYPWAGILNLAGFTRIHIDEGHYMKNPATGRAQGMMNLISIPKVSILTGTPLINRPREAFTLLRFINPELFNNYDGFVSQWEWSDGTCKNPKAFQEMLKPYMLRRLKSQVQKDLPAINRIDITHELSDPAMARYDKALQGLFEEIDKFTGDVTNTMNITHILAEFVRLKQICSDDKIDLAAETAMNYFNDTGNKMLIFSQFVGTCHAIAKKLGGECVTITGQVEFSERQKMVEEFQTNPNIHFAVCSSMAVREGLDLDKAMGVIFVDPLWAPAYHEQCEGRAYGRLSNEHGLDAYYLNAGNTIEDQIALIRARKFALISGTVDDINSVRNTNMGIDLIKMLKEEISKKMWKKK